MKAIISAGGRGTRMQPLTFTANKHFIPVANKLLIHYPIETIAQTGIKQVAITYNPGQERYIQDTLGDGSAWGLKFSYILQPEPIGLANIIQVCEEWVGDEPFVFHLGDNIFANGIKPLVEEFIRKQPDGMLTMVEHEENYRMGVPYFDKQGKLVKYVEKPKNPPHKYAVPGLYFATPKIFGSFRGKDKIKPSARGEYEISAPFTWLLEHGYQVLVEEYHGEWMDPGKFDDWLASNQYLLDQNTRKQTATKLNKTVSLQGRVKIGKHCHIKNSVIRGPVDIGDYVTIEDSFVGPYTAIADHCQLTKIHIENSVLMSGVKLNNISKPIDNSIIAPDCEVEEVSSPEISLFLGEVSKIRL